MRLRELCSDAAPRGVDPTHAESQWTFDHNRSAFHHAAQIQRMVGLGRCGGRPRAKIVQE
jgi:hypothetical protein